MVFSSPVFLFYFLPIVLFFNWVLPQKFKNYSLLLFSFIFYIWGEGELLAVMLISIITNYFFGKLIYHNRQTTKAKKSLLINIIILFYFKYFTFVFSELGFSVSKIHLPIGISFFTFQSISYLIDVYRQPNLYQPNPFKLGLYISLFPQLIAGPIVRYADVADEINGRDENINLFHSGILRFSSGLFKKMFIANHLALIANDAFLTLSTELPVSLAWLGIICYSLQIYFDFSGYSDMAIGLGRMFGFRFLENFNYPYIASSIQEFWRRWHISLSSWLEITYTFHWGATKKVTHELMSTCPLYF